MGPKTGPSEASTYLTEVGKKSSRKNKKGSDLLEPKRENFKKQVVKSNIYVDKKG